MAIIQTRIKITRGYSLKGLVRIEPGEYEAQRYPDGSYSIQHPGFNDPHIRAHVPANKMKEINNA